MKENNRPDARSFFTKHKSDLFFAALALILVTVMTVFLFRYLSLSNQSKTHPEVYGTLAQDLNDAKMKKNELESNVKSVNRELEELNKQLSALSGN